MGESLYESDGSVDPARIMTFAGLRQRFKRGEQLPTEESRMPDLYEMTTRRFSDDPNVAVQLSRERRSRRTDSPDGASPSH